LREQAGERDLRRRRALLGRDAGPQIDHRLVRLPVLRREARDDVAEVGAVERGGLVDGPREEAFPIASEQAIDAAATRFGFGSLDTTTRRYVTEESSRPPLAPVAVNLRESPGDTVDVSTNDDDATNRGRSQAAAARPTTAPPIASLTKCARARTRVNAHPKASASHIQRARGKNEARIAAAPKATAA
jgi:hypothetical protein